MREPARLIEQASEGLVPSGSWDCHMHVFGPGDQFPPAVRGAYHPPVADRKRNAALLRDLGLAHAVLIQPSAYAEDHRALVDALSHARGTSLGIGSCGPATTAADLVALKAQGIVGLRFVGVKGPGGNGYPGTQGLDVLRALAPAMAAAGMQAHVWAEPVHNISLAREMGIIGVPLVLDHLSMLGPQDAGDTRRLDGVIDALQRGNTWLKLTYFRRSALPGDYGDMQDIVSTLAAASPDRILWASDWPFVRTAVIPDPRKLLRQLQGWLGDERFAACLRANPDALFGPHLTSRARPFTKKT